VDVAYRARGPDAPLRFGLLVTNNRVRLPAVRAKIAARLDVISDGRLDFRDRSRRPAARGAGGAGVRRVWHPDRLVVGRGHGLRRGVLVDPDRRRTRRHRERDRHARALQQLIDAGFSHVVLNPPAPYPTDVVRWVTDELITPTLDHTSHGP
jgi:hypothetical protein